MERIEDVKRKIAEAREIVALEKRLTEAEKVLQIVVRHLEEFQIEVDEMLSQPFSYEQKMLEFEKMRKRFECDDDVSIFFKIVKIYQTICSNIKEEIEWKKSLTLISDEEDIQLFEDEDGNLVQLSKSFRTKKK
ncbi:hypothetical protein [Streptococcus suis]